MICFSRLLKCGQRNYRLLGVLTLALLPLTLYLALVTSLQAPALPGGPVFGVVVLVIAGLAAGQVNSTADTSQLNDIPITHSTYSYLKLLIIIII